ncbi:hypothetical protein BKA56DRAFT_577991 [Ilyonectria sp. MPI-CAGE-AT-0026]|nr:hypothetical protein BKA56DRAFT_577991 [Ilyonectria sp. MPI-CAGE-AT-0026]
MEQGRTLVSVGRAASHTLLVEISRPHRLSCLSAKRAMGKLFADCLRRAMGPRCVERRWEVSSLC